MFGEVTEENIIEKTQYFLSKAQSLMEKPKDVPRYTTVLQYEAEFKDNYKLGLVSAMKAVTRKFKKQLEEHDFTAVSDTRTT